jgi:hypothetical protein
VPVLQPMSRTSLPAQAGKADDGFSQLASPCVSSHASRS